MSILGSLDPFRLPFSVRGNQVMRRVLAFLVLMGLLAVATSRPAYGEDEKPSPKTRTDSLGDPLPPAALARLGSQRLLHGPNLALLAFAADDRSFFSAGPSAVRCWEAASGKERGAFEFPSEEIPLALSVSVDARFLACASADGVVRIRDLTTGKPLHRFDAKPSCTHLAFGPEARSVAWADSAGGLHVTDLGERRTRDLKGVRQRAVSITLSADGKLLAALLEKQDAVVLWDAASGKRLRLYAAGEGRRGRRAITAVALDPEGKLLYAATSEGSVVAWETDSLEERYHLEPVPGGLTTMALSPDGKTLAVGAAAGGVRLFAARTGKAVAVVEGETGGVFAFSRDGKQLAVAGDDGRIRLWDAASGKPKTPTKSEPVVGAAFADKGKRIVTAAPGLLTHWSVEGKAGRRVKLSGAADAASPLLSPCGRHALLIEEGEGRLFDTDRGEVRKAFAAVKVEQAVFDPAGRLLAVAGDAPNVVTLYSPQTGRKLRQLEMPLGDAPLLFSPDGRTLCAVHRAGRLERLEVATGKRRRPLRLPARPRAAKGGPPGEPTDGDLGAAVSPDGRLVAVLREERVLLCDAWQGKLVRGLDGAESALSCVAFAPGGKLIAAGGYDQAVRLWEVATGKLVATLRGHRGGVTALAFSPDGKALLSCGADGVAFLWSVAEASKLPTQGVKSKPRTIEALWEALASDDAEAAESAVREMSATPDAVAWLAKRLEAVKAADRAELKRLIERLDAEDEGVREEATRRLIALEEQARSAVEAALRSGSAEVRRRAGRILGRLDGRLSGTEARALRAVEVLELIGSAAAKKELTRLAAGAAEARLTREAAAALARLEARE
jgi:WD40 repeat protein